MSNARARDRQLKQDMLRAPRVGKRDRVVHGHELAALREQAVAEHHARAPKYGGAPKLNGRLAALGVVLHPDPVVEQAKREDAQTPVLEGEQRVPAGWVDDENGGYFLRADGNYGCGPRVLKSGHEFEAFRRTFCTGFTHGNLYAAMLCALGCEVDPAGGAAFRVTEPDGDEWDSCDDEDMFAIVERLTAERVKGT